MPARFDFNYWPPRQLEQSRVTPAETTLNEELCTDLVLIPDNARREAVYATGYWADIQDFWIETVTVPSAKDVRAEVDPVADSEEPRSVLKLLNRNHLQNSATAFRQTAKELARLDGEMREDSPFFQLVRSDVDQNADIDTAAEIVLSEFIFNRRDTRFFPHQLLIAREAISRIHAEVEIEDLDPWPDGCDEDAKLIIAKVALRWHELFLENTFK